MATLREILSKMANQTATRVENQLYERAVGLAEAVEEIYGPCTGVRVKAIAKMGDWIKMDHQTRKKFVSYKKLVRKLQELSNNSDFEKDFEELVNMGYEPEEIIPVEYLNALRTVFKSSVDTIFIELDFPSDNIKSFYLKHII